MKIQNKVLSKSLVLPLIALSFAGSAIIPYFNDMAQSNWTYRSPRGRKYHVGLYHGDESGHVIIYCNNNILAIDFSVMKRKVYSFYIERELCEMVLDPENGQFEYDFRLSDRRPSKNKEAMRYEVLDYVFMGLAGILFFSIIFSLAIAIS